MEAAFIDSSAFFVWGDQSSEEGAEIERLIVRNHPPLVTTNFILAELLSLVTKRIGKKKGLELGEKIISSSVVQLVYLDEKTQVEAWQLYKKYKDKDFDFIDATSFIFCRKQGIREVLTLDRHFSQMGFKVYPSAE